MNPKPETFRRILERLLSVICVILLIPGDTLASATYTGGSQTTAPQSSPAQGQTTKIPPDQLDSLVAPIALYPDTLVAQVLVASTYPAQVVDADHVAQLDPQGVLHKSPETALTEVDA